MKKHLLFRYLLTFMLSLFLSIGIVSGQTTIDFEIENDGYTPSGTEGTGSTDVFNRVNPDIGGNSTWIWAVEDINLTDPTITLDAINISGATTIDFSIDMLTPNTEDWDVTDELLITYSIDGGSSQNLMWVQSNDDGDDFNAPAALDLDFDGTGDDGEELPAIVDGFGAGVGNTFETFTTTSVPVSGSSLVITLEFVGHTSAAEGIYIDNIVITPGGAIPPQATWNIPEGTNGIGIDSVIKVTYDKAILNTDASEITDANIDNLVIFKETDESGTNVAFDATIDAEKRIISIDPDADLSYDQLYFVVVGPVEDAGGLETNGDTLTFTTKPDTDKDSKAIAPTSQITGTTIESDLTDSVAVFSFTISDLGTADGIETKVTQIKLTAGPNNTISFDENLDGGYLISESGISIPFAAEPVVTSNDITVTFNVGDLTIPDGEDSTYTVYLLLGTEIEDGSVIQMMIDADNHGFIADVSGSEFTSDFGTDITGNDFTLNVTATELLFTEQPNSAYVGDTISGVEVTATDLNGNIDIDYATNISITADGATLNSSPVSIAAVDGVVAFNTLSFSDAGTDVELIASNGALTNDTSDVFNIVAEPDTDLFFSEYIEGSSNNKALEICNTTGSSVTLSNYVIRINYNGNEWNEVFEFPEGKILEDNEVYVIGHAEADEDILAVTDTAVLNPYVDGTSYIVSFNGDDVRALCKVDGEDTTIIDIIGRYDLVDPGSGWNVAGINNATQNHTLLRKVDVTHGNTDWDWSAGTNEEDSEWKVFDQDVTGNLGLPTLEASSEANILTLELPGLQLTDAVIDNETSTVTMEILKDSSVTSLQPIITISGFATIEDTTITHDFTSPVNYTVTAEDGVTTQVWTVTITASTVHSPYADILDFEVSGADSIVINKVDTAITVYVPYGYTIESVAPTVKISAGAAITDTTQAHDFTNPVSYTVTAQDGLESKEWEVTFIEEEPLELSIYQIQYTEETSGDSPYDGELIETSGIVTATNDDGFFIQDGSGAWNGIYVYDGTETRTIGDNIELVAEVDEYYDLTELKNIADFTIVSSGNDLPAAEVITTLEGEDEDYESVLVKIEDAECTNDDAGNGMFEVNDGSGALLVDDVFYAATVELGLGYDITGISYYSHSERKVLPIDTGDVVMVSPVIGAPTMAPTTPSSSEEVTITANITDNDHTASELTNKLLYGSADGSEDTEVTFTETSTNNEFEGTIPASSTTVYYKITASDGTFNDEYTGSYSVITGINDPEGILSMNIFPNPNNGLFTLEMNTSKAGAFYIEIINLQGQIVFSKQIQQEGFYRDEINLSNEASGIYYIRINDGINNKVSKIMIQ